MNAVEFLDKLEQQGLLDMQLVAKLRQEVAGARKTVSAQKIAKLLIDKGHLTAFQAKKLMDDGVKSPVKGGAPLAPRASQAPADDGGLDLLDDPADDDLGLELVDDEPALTPTDDDGLELLDVVEEPPPKAAPSSPSSRTSGKAPSSRKPERETSALHTDDDIFGLTPVDSGALTPIGSGVGLTPVKDPASLSGAIASSARGGLEPIDPLATDLSAPSDLSAADPMAAPPAKPAASPKAIGKVQKVKGQSQWDTPLIVLGGGTIILLAILAFALFRFIFATNATEVFRQADEAYKAESYTQAISIFEDFLAGFPKDPQAGAAWVFIRTARMRQAVGGGNGEHALTTAKEVLAEIDQAIGMENPPVENLPAAFNEHGRPELASLLPSIAAAFATQAKNAASMTEAEKFVQRADEAMTLVNNSTYIPSSLRETVASRIDTIQEDIGLARRNINRDKALDQALAEIELALVKNDTARAFELRKALIKTYPSLESDSAVIEAVRKTTEKERELVALVEEPRQPVLEDPPSGESLQVVTAAPAGNPAPGVKDQVIAYLVRGAVYGLDATSGNVLWRRPVGMETTVHPQMMAQENAESVVLIDGQDHEVARVEGKSGALQWRLPLESNAATPAVLGERIFVASEAGLLFEVNAETGASERQVKFPQPLRSPPSVDEARGLLFQPGEHSNLYILSSETLDCKAVHYLNHRAGSIVTPPVQSRGQLFVAENAGANYCFIHILPATDEPEKLTPSQDPFRLPGNVVVPPYVYERRVLIVTDLGGIYLFEVDSGNKTKPVSIVAELRPTLREPTFGYSVAEEGQLWVADARLTRYEIQAARGELARQNIRDESSIYVAPLQRRGNVLFHARRQTNAEGVIITAADANTLRPYWTADLGTPMVGLIADPERSLVAGVSAQGDLFQVTQEVLKAGMNTQPRRPAARSDESAFAAAQRLPDGRWVFPGVAQKNQVLIVDPQSAAAPPKLVELKAPEGRATAAPVAFQGGLLVPSSAGLVYLVDADSGESLALPLRPPMEPGQEVSWQAPAISADGKEFIIANDHPKIYRVVLRQQPKPHLAALTERDLDAPLVSNLATAGGVVYGVERTPQGDSLLTFQLPGLAFERTPLPGRLAWGPHQLGDSVLLATHDRLMRWDGGEAPRWVQPLPYGPPLNPPWELNGNYLFASVQGAVWKVAAETGESSSAAEFREPLAAGPAVVGSRLLVSGSDGVLHLAPLGD
jgi:outer membrane protein assembly factor BamB